MFNFLAAKYLWKFHILIFVTAKTPREAGGYVQFFNSPSTCKNFIYWFLRVKNPHGWPEALSKIWNRHVAKAFPVSNWPQITGWIWNYLNQLNLKTMSDWSMKVVRGQYGWYMTKVGSTRDQIQPKLWLGEVTCHFFNVTNVGKNLVPDIIKELMNWLMTILNNLNVWPVEKNSLKKVIWVPMKESIL